MLNTAKKMAAGTVMGGALLVAGGFSLAHAAPSVPEAQAAGDGKINVTLTAASGEQIGALQDVSVGNAFALVNAICPVSGISEATLTDLDASGTVVGQTCGGATGLKVTFSQNGVGNGEENGNGNGQGQNNGSRGASQNAPGQTKQPAEGEPPSATPPSTPVGQQAR